jgi:flagellar basal-body rod protein FlgG
MMRALDIAATGLQAQQTNVDVISQNIANQSTTGYKLQRPAFQDLLYQTLRTVGSNSSDTGTLVPTGIQLGLGVKPGAIYRTFTQGNLTQTQNPLDLSIEGNGFFQVTLPDGSFAYTRDGTFQLNDTGEIVTVDGYPVNPTITIPQNATEISVNASGQVQVLQPGNNTPTTLGQLGIITFQNNNGLQALGNNLFQESSASGSPIVGTAGTNGAGTVQQGFLELSNVDIVTEITNLITAQRSYDFNSRIISAADQMLQTLSQVS